LKDHIRIFLLIFIKFPISILPRNSRRHTESFTCIFQDSYSCFAVNRWTSKLIYCSGEGRFSLLRNRLDQLFSNYGPRTTSGPRVLPLWSS
jgi:hypothetical protein